VWAYTARADFGLGFSPFVNSADNDAQIFVLPFVHAIDAEIAAIEGLPFPLEQYEFPFTYETRQERADDIQQFFMNALNNYLAVTIFIGICGVSYHLPVCVTPTILPRATSLLHQSNDVVGPFSD
jgi:ATP-binding cassette subfamily A (ABC1) protein 3